MAAVRLSVEQLNVGGITGSLHAGSLPHHPPHGGTSASYLLSRLLA